jgi:hypothetical protein
VDKSANWTALEVVDHLRKVEEEFAREMATVRLPPIRVSPAERLKALLVIVFMLLPGRVKVPPGAHVYPDQELDEESVLLQWDARRTELLKIVRKLQAEGSRARIVRHPVSGWMGITEATWFLAAHTIHHRYQLRRIRRATERA